MLACRPASLRFASQPIRMGLRLRHSTWLITLPTEGMYGLRKRLTVGWGDDEQCQSQSVEMITKHVYCCSSDASNVGRLYMQISEEGYIVRSLWMVDVRWWYRHGNVGWEARCLLVYTRVYSGLIGMRRESTESRTV